MTTMGTDKMRESTSTDLESGSIMVESSDEDSLYRSNLYYTKTNHSIGEISDDDDTSGSGMWDSKPFGDDISMSNNTGHSRSMTIPGSHRSSNQVSEESINIAKTENLAVMAWRMVMFAVLLFTTIAVAVVVYTFSYRIERDEFHTYFTIDSEKVYDSLRIAIDTKLEALDSLATIFVSSAREKNEIWPYTVLHDYGIKAAKMRMLSGAIALQQYQIVQEDQRSEWEAFAKAKEAWVNETIQVQREDTTLRIQEDIPDYVGNFSTSIRSGQFPTNSTGPYTPTWQTYPVVPTGNSAFYNWNAIEHSILGPGIRKVLDVHKVVIGPVLNLEGEP